MTEDPKWTAGDGELPEDYDECPHCGGKKHRLDVSCGCDDEDMAAEQEAEQWAENAWLREAEGRGSYRQIDHENRRDLEHHERMWPYGYGRFSEDNDVW